MAVKIYTKEGCPYCAQAMRSLNERGIEFEKINLTQHKDRIDELISLTGGRKVPVTVEDGHVQVGFQGGG